MMVMEIKFAQIFEKWVNDIQKIDQKSIIRVCVCEFECNLNIDFSLLTGEEWSKNALKESL